MTNGHIGRRIARFRKQNDMSLTELANLSGVSKGYLSSLESAMSESRPSGKTLYAIAQALGVTMSDLLGQKLLTESEPQITASLKEFAKQNRLPQADVRMLASINFRGDRPQTKERWAYIYQAIRMSRDLDREAD